MTSRFAPRAEPADPLRSRWATITGVAVLVDTVASSAFKPRTSPYAFQGLGVEALRYLAEAREETGLPVVTEVMEPQQVDIVAEYGVSIADLAAGIRENVVTAVERMTGLQVTEVNIVVHDVHVESDDDETDGTVVGTEAPRVR